MSIMSIEQAFHYAMNTDPERFTSITLEGARLRFYDYIFNAHNYKNETHFIRLISIHDKNIHLINSFPEKYVGSHPLYNAYTATKLMLGYDMADFESLLPGVYTQEELDNMPHVLRSRQINEKPYVFVPLPHFTREKSLVWRMNLHIVDASWIKAGIGYYQKAQEFFSSEDAQLYYDAYTEDEIRLHKKIKLTEGIFAMERVLGMDNSEFYEKISAKYHFHYTGNTQEFLKITWTQELARIFTFIEETILHLKQHLPYKL